jgi:nitroreductase
VIALLVLVIAAQAYFLWKAPAKQELLALPDRQGEAGGGSSGSFLTNLTWRRAVKHFAEGEVDVEPIKDAITNAPSSFGIQPYRVYVVTDMVKKETLRDVCFDQSQISESYALFVFCALKDVDARAEAMIAATGADQMRDMVKGFLSGMPDKVDWAKRQAYIALGFGLAAAAERKIASCPMEGFMADKVAEILGITDAVPCVMLAVGKQDETETLHPRFRFSDVISV